jgi:hypothetical protein
MNKNCFVCNFLKSLCSYRQENTDYVPHIPCPLPILEQFLFPWFEQNVFIAAKLEPVLGGPTSSPNEARHSSLWGFISKIKRQGFCELQAAAAVSTIVSNSGYRGLGNLILRMGFLEGENCKQAYKSFDMERNSSADHRIQSQYKRWRRQHKYKAIISNRRKELENEAPYKKGRYCTLSS